MSQKSSVSYKRHLLKTITWRIIATLTTILLAWLFTKDTALALKFGAVEVIIKMVFYFLHERAWYTWTDFGVNHKNNPK